MAQPTATDRIIIFGRYPQPGKTKTRLIPALGPVGAAELQRQLTEKTLSTVQRAAYQQGITVEVCIEGGTEGQIRRWLGKDVYLSHQSAGNLGRKMHRAFIEAFDRGDNRVLLLGTDISDLTSRTLTRAFDILAEKDLVLGPSTDGGYWLMGLKQPVDLFRDVLWGSEKVLKQTLSLAKHHTLEFELLPSLTDIDTEDDLKHCFHQYKGLSPYLSIVIPALNEADNITKAINSAKNPDSEIIIADGGSIDETVKRAVGLGVRVVESPRGRALQQNSGARTAQGQVLLFLHGDTQLPKGYESRVFEALMDKRTSVGAFRFKTDLDSPSMRFIELGANLRTRYLGRPYGDQGLFMRKSLFESVGGFPESPIAEDLLFLQKVPSRHSIRAIDAAVITSARRMKTFGPLRTWLINLLIVAGLALRISPNTLARLYRLPRK